MIQFLKSKGFTDSAISIMQTAYDKDAMLKVAIEYGYNK